MPEENEDFVISRTFDAPKKLVWSVWTEEKHLAKWFGPKGISLFTAKLDLRPGGVFHYCMKRPDAKEMWGKFVYREILPERRLVWVNSFSDPQAGITRHPWNADWPLELLTTVTFAEHEGKTTVMVRWSPLNPTDAERKTFQAGFDSMNKGWGGTCDVLAEYLASQQA
jgi:uncharacterized protein YndB with AHSA1/START domain